MNKILILKGLPASGKSTYAKVLLEKDKGNNWVRINKDLLRSMCHNSIWSKSNEKLIIKLRNTLILELLEQKKNIIIDDTNFGKHEQQIKLLVGDKAEVLINDSFLETPLEECIKRDLLRPISVGKDVIMQMYNRYLRVEPIAPIYNLDKSNAIIVDMDGTLSLLNGRNPYDQSTCEQDLVNEQVANVVRKFENDCNVIIVSGRTDSCKAATERWLVTNDIKYTNIHMRKTGDNRPDTVVKEEIYRNFIQPFYNVNFVLDDRPSVCRQWRKMGLFILQVGDPDIEF